MKKIIIIISSLFICCQEKDIEPKLCGKVTEKIYFKTDKQPTPYNIIIQPIHSNDEILVNITESDYKLLNIGQNFCTKIDSTKYFK